MLTWIGSPESQNQHFLFLDRDGVINVDRPDHVKHWREFHFHADALEALRWLEDHRTNVILISNQSGLGRGLTRWEDFWDMHLRMILRIREEGGDILAAFYCPHAPEAHCSCRKPSPGMLLEASRLYSIPLPSTTMIGDKATDLMAAQRVGCRAALIERTGIGRTTVQADDFPCSGAIVRYTTLLEAVVAIAGATLV